MFDVTFFLSVIGVSDGPTSRPINVDDEKKQHPRFRDGASSQKRRSECLGSVGASHRYCWECDAFCASHSFEQDSLEGTRTFLLFLCHVVTTNTELEFPFDSDAVPHGFFDNKHGGRFSYFFLVTSFCKKRAVGCADGFFQTKTNGVETNLDGGPEWCWLDSFYEPFVDMVRFISKKNPYFSSYCVEPLVSFKRRVTVKTFLQKNKRHFLWISTPKKLIFWGGKDCAISLLERMPNSVVF